MSIAIKELSSLLAAQSDLAGIVTAVGENEVAVATPNGGRTAKTTARLRVGDKVTLRAGWASKTPQPDRTFSV